MSIYLYISIQSEAMTLNIFKSVSEEDLCNQNCMVQRELSYDDNNFCPGGSVSKIIFIF